MCKLLIFLLIFCIHLLLPVELTISTPGLVQLGDNITFNPSVTNDSIIQISASNVTLDLGERIISQGNTTANTLGIVVDDNLSNVTITNGTIFNLTGTAIRIGQNCQNITISNIETYTCGGRGVELNFADATSTFDCFLNNLNIVDVQSEAIYIGSNCARIVIENMFIDRCSTNLFGINCNGAAANRITSCIFKDIILSRCGSGVRFSHTDDSKLENIRVLSSANTGAFSGFYLLGSAGNQARGNILNNCIVEDVISATDVAGYRLEQAGQNILKNCVVKYETNSITTVRGFYLFSSSQNNMLINCSALNILGTGAGGDAVAGFYMSGAVNTMLTDCEVLTTVAGSAISGDAFRCATSSCGVFKRLVSSDTNDEGIHVVTSNTDLIFRNCQALCTAGDGFTIEGSNSNIILDGCAALNCVAGGFRFISSFDVLIVNCFSSDSPNGFFVSGTTNDDINICDCLATNCVDGYENDDGSTTVLFCKATNNSGTGFINNGGAGPDFALNAAMENGTNYTGVANPVGPTAGAIAGGNLDA